MVSVRDELTLTIRVHPGASRGKVGGIRAEPGHEKVIGVWVTQRAVEGQATEAALRALAAVLGVRRSALRLVTGATSRIKIVAVADPPADLAARLAALPG